MNKQWELYNIDEKQVEILKKGLGLSDIVARILTHRGLKGEEELQVFLNPTRNNFHDPFLMNDMEKAVGRILLAIENKEKVVIYGDYDVDGITSSTVLKKYFLDRELEADIYIPNRINEGYGLNKEAIGELSKKYTLMITVDCGITGTEEVKQANKDGLDVIITDHHEVGEILPDAIAVIDAKRADSNYPFRGLAGVGVTFKLIQAISEKLKLPAEAYLKYLDLVAVGTISDIVPLEDENRVISKLGLKLVKQTKNIGLRVLLKNINYKKIDSNTVSFRVGTKNKCLWKARAPRSSG